MERSDVVSTLEQPVVCRLSARAILMLLTLASTTWAQTHSADEAPQRSDEVWLVSSRQWDWGTCPVDDQSAHGDLPNFQVTQYLHDQGWSERSVPELLSSTKTDLLTVVYVHGNRVEEYEILERARNAYQATTRELPVEARIRFIIWSWPSDQVRGHLRDVRIKAQQTKIESYYLARLLEEFDPQTRLRFIGYSYGARVVTGALHLRNGGVLAGRQLSPFKPDRPAVRVALLAAALGSNWLYDGCLHGNALGNVEEMLNLFNSCDPVLKRYYLVERDRCIVALGYTGVAFQQPPGLLEYDVNATVGRTHSEAPYFESDEIMQLVLKTLQLEDG